MPLQGTGGCQEKPRLRIGGFFPVTSSDYNGMPAAEVLCQGCPWHCTTCRHPELMDTHAPATMQWSDIFNYLAARQGLIEHVIFSGTEPLSQRHLVEAIVQCKSMGLVVGLHTCGIFPLRLETVLPLIDWLSFGILGMPDDYALVNGLEHSGQTAWTTLQSAVNYGTPVICELNVPSDAGQRHQLYKTIDALASFGVERLVLRTTDELATLADLKDHLLQQATSPFRQVQLRCGHRPQLL